MEENNKIEKSINVSLDEFMAKNTSQEGVSVVAEQPVEESIEQVEQPKKILINPDDIKIKSSYDGDGTKNVLKEDDVEKIPYGDSTIKISKKVYTIKSISTQTDKFKNKLINQDFTYKRDKSNKWIQTRLEIFYENSDYKSSLPNIKYFKDNNDASGLTYVLSFKKITTEKEFKSSFVSEVSKLYYKYCIHFKIKPGELKINDFFKQLIGKKVILKESDIEFNGNSYNRLFIHKFV